MSGTSNISVIYIQCAITSIVATKLIEWVLCSATTTIILGVASGGHLLLLHVISTTKGIIYGAKSTTRIHTTHSSIHLILLLGTILLLLLLHSISLIHILRILHTSTTLHSTHTTIHACIKSSLIIGLILLLHCIELILLAVAHLAVHLSSHSTHASLAVHLLLLHRLLWWHWSKRIWLETSWLFWFCRCCLRLSSSESKWIAAWSLVLLSCSSKTTSTHVTALVEEVESIGVATAIIKVLLLIILLTHINFS